MSDLIFTMIFEGIDPEAEPDLDASSDARYYFSYANNLAYVTVVVDGRNCIDAAFDLVDLVEHTIPGARALKVDPDLVSVSDIAERAGLSRETVRLYAAGRRFAGFPAPIGVVGDNIRIWAWSEVNDWLQDHGHGVSEQSMGWAERAKVDAMLANRQALPVPPPTDAESKVTMTYGTESTVKSEKTAGPGSHHWRQLDHGKPSDLRR